MFLVLSNHLSRYIHSCIHFITSFHCFTDAFPAYRQENYTFWVFFYFHYSKFAKNSYSETAQKRTKNNILCKKENKIACFFTKSCHSAASPPLCTCFVPTYSVLVYIGPSLKYCRLLAFLQFLVARQKCSLLLPAGRLFNLSSSVPRPAGPAAAPSAHPWAAGRQSRPIASPADTATAKLLDLDHRVQCQ